jgi:adenine-specific DNA-methyltransferase
MPRKKAANATDTSVLDYRHDAKRKNIPPAGLAAQGRVRETPRMQFAYDPHLPPVLRFDSTGVSDTLPELLETARIRPLTAEEVELLAEVLRHREPWLEWAGKREKKGFEVEPVALHIHERVAAQAILKIAARENVQRDLFADPQLDYREAVQFYQHDVDWANRMILGDSLQVMASLARREDLAGKVQMIYMDPPYGIKFASNFQPEIGKRDVKDKESDLTREPEVVKAYRDTWTLGVHSYLAYLRDRLILCRELLTDSGSIFVQISDENLHRIRSVMDEVFGTSNFVSVITVKKTTSASGERLSSVADFLLWYAREKERMKYRSLFRSKQLGEEGGTQYTWREYSSGERRNVGIDDSSACEGVVFRQDNLTSQRPAQGADVTDFNFEGRDFSPGKGTFKTDLQGLRRLAAANRLIAIGNTLSYVRHFKDFPVFPGANLWVDTVTSGFAAQKIYVVQTNPTIIERCLLMTTNPGDLVLDPTCGGGTTACVAEQWGRRWITIDTSRVAMALARQRLLTATFPFYKVKGSVETNGHQSANPALGFVYKTVPHIALKSIAQNVALDAIFARHQPILEEKLTALNAALKTVTPELRRKLAAKLLEKERREGKKAVTDAESEA